MTIAAFRRAPESFTDQRYYSWMAFEYKAKDGVPRYAKFRLVPADDRNETGLMTEEEQRKPWYDLLPLFVTILKSVMFGHHQSA